MHIVEYEDPTHLQDSQYEKSGPLFSIRGGIPCDTYG